MFYAFLGIVFFCTIGIGGVFLGKFLYAPKTMPTPPIAVTLTPRAEALTTTPIQDVTGNWKTYSNQKYGYQMRYPQDWYLFPDGTAAIGGENISAFANFDLNQGPRKGSLQDLRIDVRVDPLTRSFDDYLNARSEKKVTTSSEEVLVDEKHGVKWTIHGLGTSYLVLVPNNGRVYSIIGPAENSTQIEIFDQILSTFKFLDNNSSAIDLPVTELKTGYGIEGEAATYPASISVQVPRAHAKRIAAYGVMDMEIVAPSLWTGEGQVGADGSRFASLYPASPLSVNSSPSQGPGILVEEIPACVYCAIGDAEPYFSQAREWFRKQHSPTTAPQQGLVTTFISPQLVQYRLPDTLDGLEVQGVAYIQLTNNEPSPPFFRMEVRLPKEDHDLAAFLLNTFIERQIPKQ